MKFDITKNNIYIGRMINVLKSSLGVSKKLLKTNGRDSDAFIYIVNGSCSYEFDDGARFTAKKGDVLYLADGAVYSMKITEEPYDVHFCNFDFICDKPRKSSVFTPKNTAEAENLFGELHRAYLRRGSRYIQNCTSVLYKIYSLIIKTANTEYVGSRAEQKIREAKGFVDRNLTDTTLNVSALAETAGVSEVYFRKKFRAVYGLTPSKYIISARIENAKHLIRFSHLCFEQIALQSGFSSLNYFCRCFKSVVGTTPSEYRRELKA